LTGTTNVLPNNISSSRYYTYFTNGVHFGRINGSYTDVDYYSANTEIFIAGNQAAYNKGFVTRGPSVTDTASDYTVPLAFNAIAPDGGSSHSEYRNFEFRYRTIASGLGASDTYITDTFSENVSYTVHDYGYQVYETVTVTYPPGVQVASVTPYSIIQSYTYTNNVLTFYFKPYTDQFSGDAARLRIRAEDGTEVIEYLCIQ
jgi:hypothetical protein